MELSNEFIEELFLKQIKELTIKTNLEGDKNGQEV